MHCRPTEGPCQSVHKNVTVWTRSGRNWNGLASIDRDRAADYTESILEKAVKTMLWNAKNGWVPLKEGTMPYASFGHGPRTLIILPGLSDGLATVEGKALLLIGPYRPYLKDFTIYMFSRREPLPEGHSIRDMAADQAEALRALGIGRTCVLGVSEGGMIAQRLAIDHTELVEKLVLAVTVPCTNDVVRSCVPGWMDMARRGDHKALMIDTAERSYSPAHLKRYRKLYPLLGRVGRPRSYDRFLTNARAILSFDACEDLPRIACPTLILGGEEDRIVGPEASRLLAARIPNSALFMYPGLGHAAYEEAKDFYGRVFAFLREGA